MKRFWRMASALAVLVALGAFVSAPAQVQATQPLERAVVWSTYGTTSTAVVASTVVSTTTAALTVSSATPDTPRNVVMVIADNYTSLTTLNGLTVTVVGEPMWGGVHTETLIGNQGTASAWYEVEGVVPWQSITSARYSNADDYGTTDAVALYWGDKYGLPVQIGTAGDLVGCWVDGTTTTSVTADPVWSTLAVTPSSFTGGARIDAWFSSSRAQNNRLWGRGNRNTVTGSQ